MTKRISNSFEDRCKRLHEECRTRARIPITSTTSLEERRRNCNHRYEHTHKMPSRYCVCCGKKEP